MNLERKKLSFVKLPGNSGDNQARGKIEGYRSITLIIN